MNIFCNGLTKFQKIYYLFFCISRRNSYSLYSSHEFTRPKSNAWHNILAANVLHLIYEQYILNKKSNLSTSSIISLYNCIALGLGILTKSFLVLSYLLQLPSCPTLTKIVALVTALLSYHLVMTTAFLLRSEEEDPRPYLSWKNWRRFRAKIVIEIKAMIWSSNSLIQMHNNSCQFQTKFNSVVEPSFSKKS